jgi:hypothetical protein
VVAAVAPAAALLFSGAAAWASLTAPQPAPAPAEVTNATEPVEVGARHASSEQLAALQARVQADRRRLDALRARLSARPQTRAPQAAPASPQRPAAAPRPAAPPPPVDTSTGASG